MKTSKLEVSGSIARGRLQPAACRLGLAPIAVAVAMLGSLSSQGATAQTTDAGATAPGTTLERVYITGSNIKRLAAEGPLPVEIISKEDIDRKGVASTSDLLRSLSYMSSSNDEMNIAATGLTGTTSMGFRGLAGNQTVVLLNGRRLANFGFDGAFVDLNSIPLGAIQRVEVLKDGASAIYGADAIGGVVNFITRKDYRGVELGASQGESSRGDAKESTASVTAGWGNLDTDRFNVLANLSFFKRDALYNKDRDRTSTADYRRFGGTNQTSTTAPTGNFVNPVTNQWTTLLPCPDPKLLLSPSPLSPGVAGSSSCMFDFAPYRMTNYSSERLGGMVAGRLKVNDTMQFFSELLFSNTKSYAAQAPGNAIFTVATTNPLNTFGVPIAVRARPLQAGVRAWDTSVDATRLLAGVEGTFGKVEYNLGVGQARSKAAQVDAGYLLTNKLNAAIANNTFNPFVTSNPQSVVDALKSDDVRRGETTYTFLDGRASTDLMELPAGPLTMAAGFQLGKEAIADNPGTNSAIGNIFGGYTIAPLNSDRKLTAIFSELNIPILKQVEAQLAIRNDRYSGGVSSTTPKIAIKYQPTSQVLLRASYAEGFKMASLRDLYGGALMAIDNVQDLLQCRAGGVADSACPRFAVERSSSGNAKLKPETSKGLNFGLAIEPTRDNSIGIDHFVINKTDEIGLVPTDFIIANIPYAINATTALAGNPGITVVRNSTGTLTRINSGVGNLGKREIEGTDLTFSQRFNVPIGRVAIDGSGTYYSRYRYSDLPGQLLYDRIGLLNLPRWRTQLRVSLKTGDLDASITANSRSSFYDKSAASASTPVSATQRVIGNMDTYDLSMVYTGFKSWRLALTVKNLMDRVPPFSDSDPRALGFSQLDDIRGRYFTLSGSVAF